MGRDRAPARQELRGHGALEPEKVFHLPREDDQGDSAREPDGDGVGDELDRPAQPCEAEADEDDARHEGGHREAFHPVPLHDRVDDDDEGARRPADLHARATQGGDEKSCDNRGEQPALGADPARNRERDREREGHDSDDDPRTQICEELLASVVRERRDELRDEPVHGPPAGDVERPEFNVVCGPQRARSASIENAPPPVTMRAARAPRASRWYSNPSLPG